MRENTWRDACRPVIAEVLAKNKGKSESEIKAALRAAFPFGARAYHPYKIWLSEIRVQLGKKKPPFGKGEERQVKSCDGQKGLFE